MKGIRKDAKKRINEYLEKHPNIALDMYYSVLHKISLAISDFRHEKHLSQKEMASLLQVSQVMVSKLESGDYNYTVLQLCNVCEKLGWKLDVEIINESEQHIINYVVDTDYNFEEQLPTQQGRELLHACA